MQNGIEMRTVESKYHAKTEVKGSKFLAFLVPYVEFEQLRESLRLEYPKASHIVYAYRFLNEFNQIVENSSDDGEPKGAASVPMMNVLRGEELVDVAVVVVRYFGGTKLGVGGMIRAYGGATKEVISISDIREYEILEDLIFFTMYRLVQRVEYLTDKTGVAITKREFLGSEVEWRVNASRNRLTKFKELLGRDARWSA